jgi:3-hydroxyisobutyrate dehydrogenase-like beta-hydroxyacid dehydrogenase
MGAGRQNARADMTTRLGWLGTGRMGAAMARRLVDAGEDVQVWNRTAAKAEPLVERGASRAATIRELAARDVVFVMVSTPHDLYEVICGAGGLLDGDSAPRIIVDSSTVSQGASAHVRNAVVKVGSQFLAAPVSGNPHVVARGDACIVASGPQAVFDEVRPYLERIARVAVYAGDGEQSRLVKLCHNLYLGMVVQALVEVVCLAEKGGTPPAAFLQFLNGTVLGSDWVRSRTPDLVGRDWTPTFTTELLRKDFDLGLGAARELEVPMPVASSVYQLIQAAIGLGHRDDDFLSLYAVQAQASAIAKAHSTSTPVD